MVTNSLIAIHSVAPLLFGNPSSLAPDKPHEGELETARRLMRGSRTPLLYQGVSRLGSSLFKPANPAHRFAILSKYDFSNIIRVLVRAEAIGTATAVNPVLGFALAVAACDEAALYQTPEELCLKIKDNAPLPADVHLWDPQGSNARLSQCTSETSVQYIVCDPAGSVISVENDFDCGRQGAVCDAGVCSAIGGSTCYDPDGEEPRTASSISGRYPNGQRYQLFDVCRLFAPREVFERICDDKRPDHRIIPCEADFVCIDGACVPEPAPTLCHDSDSAHFPGAACDPSEFCEINPENPGFTLLELGPGLYTDPEYDFCGTLSGIILLEGYCFESEAERQEMTCGPTQSCQGVEMEIDGEIVYLGAACVEGRIPPECIAGITEDGIPFIRGILENGQTYLRPNECGEDGTYLWRYSCDEEEHPVPQSVYCPEAHICDPATVTCQVQCDGVCQVFMAEDGVPRVIDADCQIHPAQLCTESGNLELYGCGDDGSLEATGEFISCEHGCSDGQCL